jgi:hypothetical protein
MEFSFDSFPWHDARLMELLVDRRHPGENDEVCLKVIWPEGGGASVHFRDCYAMSAEMNFGIISDEQIACAEIVNNDAALTSVKRRWKDVGVCLHDLRCYKFEMSSTGSIIKIYARVLAIDFCEQAQMM